MWSKNICHKKLKLKGKSHSFFFKVEERDEIQRKIEKSPLLYVGNILSFIKKEGVLRGSLVNYKMKTYWTIENANLLSCMMVKLFLLC